METILVIALVSGIFTLGFINRAFHLFCHPWVGKDTSFHLRVARYIREHGRLPRELPNNNYPQPYDLPPFPHIFLALWPERFHKKLQYLAPIMDLVIGLIILAGCLASFGLQTAIIAVTFHFFTPMSRDNYYSLNPRAFGNTFLIAALFTLFIFYETSWPLVLIVASIFAALTILSHRLSLQSMSAVLICLTIGLKSLAPLLVLAMGFLMAFVFTKGYLIKILKGHFDFVYNRARSIKKLEIRAALHAFIPNPLQMLFNIPLLIMIPLFFFISDDVKINFFLIWGLALLVLSFLWVFGEGYRHLANSTVPFSILAAVWVVNHAAYYVLTVFLVLSLVFTVVKIFRVEKELTCSPDSSRVMTLELW